MRMKYIEITVGAFMLAGILALVMLALKVSGLSGASTEGTYTVHAYFENIGGLNARSKVTLSGVQIGQVQSIELDDQRVMADVTMEIYDSVDYLTQDSSAQILTAGLLGEQYIGISIGADEEVLKDGDVIRDTQSALVLEDLVSKFLFNEVSK